MSKKHTNVNLSQGERIASLMGGGALIAYGLKKQSWVGMGLAAVGGLLTYRGATGHCQAYEALGVNRRGRRGSNVSVPYESGTRVDASLTVNIPRAQAYRFWRNLENLSKFMEMVQSVNEIDNRTSHWVIKVPGGASAEWTAEIINEVENQLIGWRSVDGDIGIAGSVHFKDAPGGGTEISLENQYEPPGGRLTTWVARLAGIDPARQLSRDLEHFKELMETGQVSGKEEKLPGKKGWQRDQVEEASEESFPASDPPSWAPGVLAH